jgi:predicted porin
MDVNGLVAFEEIRASNAIAYVSPNMNGLTVAAAIIPGEGGVGFNGLANAYSLGVMYKNNGLRLALAYENMDDFAPIGNLGGYAYGGATKHTKTLFGAGYTMNAFDAALAYQYADLGGLAPKIKSLAISGGYSFGNNKIIATVAQLKQGATKFDAYGLGIEHNFSKRTKAYAAYAQSEMGLTGTPGGPGSFVSFPFTSKGLSVGMIHNF